MKETNVGTWDKSDGVFAAILSGLEDIGLNASKGLSYRVNKPCVSSSTVLHANGRADAHLAEMEERKEVGAATRRSKDCQA